MLKSLINFKLNILGWEGLITAIEMEGGEIIMNIRFLCSFMPRLRVP